MYVLIVKYSLLKMTNLWNVSSELLQNCYQMSLDNDLTDVTFVTTDLDEVRAHKVILSANP